MTPTKRFWTIYIFILLICVPTIVYTSLSFDNIELNKVNSWTLNYFVLPIFLIVTSLTIYIYRKHFRKVSNDNGLFPLSKAKLNSFYILTYITISISTIFVATTHSAIVLSNAHLGDTKNIIIETEILNTYVRNFKGYSNNYIIIKDKQTDKNIELNVTKSYQIGQLFREDLIIGRWGIIFSKK